MYFIKLTQFHGYNLSKEFLSASVHQEFTANKFEKNLLPCESYRQVYQQGASLQGMYLGAILIRKIFIYFHKFELHMSDVVANNMFCERLRPQL